ncbi:RsmB/NOP family class I SAM-dependent RNA methyltransferase [Flavimaricola marinus]|uniref:Ribosomal RNA small subunit methyltransferase B n=1 Tax=Flavimaricola marinus TaxID=1819565 RepID=A0A238LHW3_9RHOB|nr:transcription antitermination factor NusB [Flavimaricola marinus]SMY08994.1 Ribosomal RNA small subunit methyltransferase B [Flavimaricola marinus]
MADQDGRAPRKAALDLLQGVTAEGRLLPELMAAGALSALPPEDRARAQRLAIETLRAIDRADRLLKPYLQRNPPLIVRNVLRLGVVEIVGGAAPHGVVNAMVGIVGQGKRTAQFKGLVNAVLRKVAADPAAWDKLPAPRLPGWLRQPLVAAWGRPAVETMEAVQAVAPPLDLTPKADPQAVAAAVGGIVLPTGSVRLASAGQVTALPGYDSGDWWVQDAAAALPVRLLAPKSGEKVLDLCAAPGGKTMQMAAAEASVTAIDLSEARMARVSANLARTGLTAEVIVADAMAFDRGGFDAVLLDAPCSATGTMRRHPDLPVAKDGSEFGALIAQQEVMIDHALSLLRPGGRLVFCTCSLLPDEGEVQIDEALARHPGLTVDRAALDVPGVDPAWRTEEGGLRLRPDYWADQGGMDGFYMACLTTPA